MRILNGKRAGKHIFVSVLVVLLSLSAIQIQPSLAQVSTVYYAAPNPMGAGDCSSWQNACTLQTALTTAVAPAEIWVKAGVHKPTSDPGNRDAAFNLRSGVEVYGGFSGVETAREQRDWQLNFAILSGDIDSDDLNSDGNFIIEDVVEIQGNNSYHVVKTSGGVDSTALLDGVIVTAGMATGPWQNASNVGGGLFIQNSYPLIKNLNVSGNYAAGGGGGLENFSGGPTIMNTRFAHNFSEYRGGGMGDSNNMNTTLINCDFYDNVSRDSHGAAIETNYSKISGGTLKIINTVFYQNFTPYSVAAIFADSANLQLYNVTISDNASLAGDPAAVYSYQSNWTLANVVIWENQSPGNIEFQRDSSYYSSVNIINSDIAGCGASGAAWNFELCGSDGGGNIQADPLFVNSGFGNFRLSQTSPAVDAGNNNFVPAEITTDLDGRARFVDMPVLDTGIGTPPIVDMGAYETYEDATAPTVTSVITLDASPTSAQSVRFWVSFSEPVFGVNADALLPVSDELTGTYVEYVTGGPYNWEVGVNTGTGDGSLRLDVPAGAEIWDLAGNPVAGLPYQNGQSYIIDHTPPEVLSSLRAGPDPTGNSIVEFTVTFTEAVLSLDTSDFELTLDENITGASVDSVLGGDTSYTVRVITGSGNGTLRLDIAEEAEIRDLSGNLIIGLPYNEGEAYTIDKTAPTVVSILRLDPNPTPDEQVDYAVTFSESVFGVGAADFEVVGFAGNSGASVTNVSGSGDAYVVTVSTGVGGGRLRLDLDEGAWIWDAADNLFNGPFTGGEEYTLLQLPLFLPQLSK